MNHFLQCKRICYVLRGSSRSLLLRTYQLGLSYLRVWVQSSFNSLYCFPMFLWEPSSLEAFFFFPLKYNVLYPTWSSIFYKLDLKLISVLLSVVKENSWNLQTCVWILTVWLSASCIIFVSLAFLICKVKVENSCNFCNQKRKVKGQNIHKAFISVHYP